MGVTLRAISYLDVHDGRVIKGVNFRDLKDAGDPVELAARYRAKGANELTFLGISASAQGRGTTREMVTRYVETAFIPLTVGSGVRSVTDVDAPLHCGTSKAGINIGALADPGVIDKIAARFGNQVLVLPLDARRTDWVSSGFEVTTHGGRRPAGRDATEWAKKAVDRDVGGVLLSFMGADGITDGFDIGMARAVRAVMDVPLIVSGGAGATAYFIEATHVGADTVLAASVFHYGGLTTVGIKQELARAGLEVRGV